MQINDRGAAIGEQGAWQAGGRMSERGMIDVKHWAAAVGLGISVILLLLSVGLGPLGPVDHGGSRSVIATVAATGSAHFDHEAASRSNPAATCHAAGDCSPVALSVTSIAGQRLAAATTLHRPPSHRAGSRLIDPDIRPPIA